MNQKRRGIIYSIVAVVCLIAVFLIVWQVLGNSAKEIDENVFKENFNSYVKVNLNYYKVICVDENGQKYSFTIVDRNELDDFIKAGIYNTSNANKPVPDKYADGNVIVIVRKATPKLRTLTPNCAKQDNTVPPIPTPQAGRITSSPFCGLVCLF